MTYEYVNICYTTVFVPTKCIVKHEHTRTGLCLAMDFIDRLVLETYTVCFNIRIHDPKNYKFTFL